MSEVTEKIKEELMKRCKISKQRVDQFLYTYDLPTIYGRYVDIITQLEMYKTDIKYETAILKLKLLFNEVDNLLLDEDKKELKDIIGNEYLSELLKKDNLITILKKDEVLNFISKFKNNDKKWIRLRQTGNITTLTVKHILADNGSNIQQMLETEMVVPSIKEANNFLEALGLSYKSYQEKRRVTYVFDEHEIDIDTWPGIPTYFEVEGKDKEDLIQILEKLGYSIDNAVSCTADQIYKMYGKSMFDSRELKF